MALAAGMFLAILGADTGIAAQVDAITVTHRDDGFNIVFDGVVDAAPRQVYALLADQAEKRWASP